jgi:50S ribosomal subunit-associated GTPase HflX
MDSDTAEENLKIFRQRFAKVEIVPISAELEIGLDVLRTALFERVAKAATAIAP